jgi:hypothetical protein
VVVETEFNKGADVNGHYADEMSALLGAKIDLFQSRGIAAMTSVGGWDMTKWHRFQTAIESGDYAGTTLVWSCKKEPSPEYETAAAHITQNVAALHALVPDMKIIVPDFALSTFSGCPDGFDYATKQEDAIKDLEARRETLKESGVVGLNFRHLVDKEMDPRNYHGQAEDFWGFKSMDAAHTPKGAYDDVILLVRSEMGQIG